MNGSFALGMWTGQPWEEGKIDAGIGLLGRAPAILLTYQSWNGRKTEFLDDDARVIARKGAAWMMTWEPDGSLKDIAAGKWDAYLADFAKQAAAWGGTIYLRYMHEMNGDWYPWGVYRNHGGTAADFVSAWRRTHDIFVANGATNVKWVWSPNVTYPNGEYPFANLYPGSAYVDWVGLDGYNWGGQVGGHPGWQTFTQIFQASYNQVVGYGKPIVIAETASAEGGGNKASWITSTFLTEIPTKMPRIKAVIWFNQSAETDFRINSSPATLDAFRQVGASSAWRARLP